MTRREQSNSSQDINASTSSENIPKPSGFSHSFDTGVAAECGLESAVIYNHICFWITHNKSLNEHFIEGRTWTYQSRSQMASIFQYLTTEQVRRALERLVKKGFIITGKFHENKFKHELWYALPDESILRFKDNSNKHYDKANLPNHVGKNAKTIQIRTNTDSSLSIVSKDTLDKEVTAPSSRPQNAEIKNKIIFSSELTKADIDAGKGKVVIPQEKWDDYIQKYGIDRVTRLANELSEGMITHGYKYKCQYIALKKWIDKDIKNQSEGKVTSYNTKKKHFRQDYPDHGKLPVDHVELQLD